MLQINISIDLQEALETFNQMNKAEVFRAGSRAINQTLVTLRKESLILLRKQIRLSATLLREKYIWIEKSNPNTLSGSLCFSSSSIPLLEFVKGPKNISTEDQIGVKVAKRKKLRLEIRPGHTFKLQHAFIQKAGSKQVFKRKGEGFKTQLTPSIGSIVRRRKIEDQLRESGTARFGVLFARDLEARLNRTFKSGPRER